MKRANFAGVCLFGILHLFLTCQLLGESPRQRVVATSQPYAGVVYTEEQQAGPNRLFVITVDLKDLHITIHVAPGGPDPDGPGEFQTTLLPVSEIAEREKFEIAVNASFFSIGRIREGQKPDYRYGIGAASVGWAMTDGKLWGAVKKDNWPVVWVVGERDVHLGLPESVPADARQVVCGNAWVLQDGKRVEYAAGTMMTVKHPRTVIGLNQDRSKLILLTVDGRREGVSVGMTGHELADVMLRLGAQSAVNLDGGGSTTLVLRDEKTHQVKVMNQPSDGHERNIADVLGIDVKTD